MGFRKCFQCDMHELIEFHQENGSIVKVYLYTHLRSVPHDLQPVGAQAGNERCTVLVKQFNTPPCMEVNLNFNHAEYDAYLNIYIYISAAKLLLSKDFCVILSVLREEVKKEKKYNSRI